MGCIEKLYFIGLTSVLAYQTYYNLTGAMELGGKYMDTKMLVYSVGSLVPAIILGIHACKIAFAKSDEARQTLAASCLSKVIVWFYVATLGLCCAAEVYVHLKSNTHQLGYETIVSFKRSRTFLIYYWIILQYGLAWVLMLSYVHVTRKISASAKKASEQNQTAVKSESLNSFSEPIISEETVYENNSIV